MAGATVGTLCSELYERVDKLIKNSNQVNPLLDQIKGTLDSLESLIDSIQDHQNKEFDLSNDDETEKFLKKRIANGVKLLDACLEDPKWHYKLEYTEKLDDLDDYLTMVLMQILVILAVEGQIENEDDVEEMLSGQQPDQPVDELARPASSDLADTMEIVTKLTILVAVFMLFLIPAVITMVVWVIKIMFRGSSGIKVVDEFLDYSWFGESWTLLFLARLGVLLLMIFVDGVVKYSIYYSFFYCSMASVVGSVLSFQNLYRRGFSWSGFRKPFFLTAWTVYFLYCCVLLFTSVKCHCKS